MSSHPGGHPGRAVPPDADSRPVAWLGHRRSPASGPRKTRPDSPQAQAPRCFSINALGGMADSTHDQGGAHGCPAVFRRPYAVEVSDAHEKPGPVRPPPRAVDRTCRGGIGCDNPAAPTETLPVQSIAVTGTLSLRSRRHRPTHRHRDPHGRHDEGRDGRGLLVDEQRRGQRVGRPGHRDRYGSGTITVSMRAHATVPFRIVPDGRSSSRAR